MVPPATTYFGFDRHGDITLAHSSNLPHHDSNHRCYFHIVLHQTVCERRRAKNRSFQRDHIDDAYVLRHLLLEVGSRHRNLVLNWIRGDRPNHFPPLFPHE